MDLLYSIFPGDVAQKLWQGQPVPARKFDDVTMLFSDIVGFTAVCAQCTPMQVISMLNELYTRFDYQCGILDVYKVSQQKKDVKKIKIKTLTSLTQTSHRIAASHTHTQMIMSLTWATYNQIMMCKSGNSSI